LQAFPDHPNFETPESSAASAPAEQLGLSETRLVDLLKQVENLTGRLGHDLRGPLNLVLGYADLLNIQSAGPLTAKQKQFVEHIRNGAKAVAKEIDRTQEILDTLVKSGPPEAKL